MENINQEKTAKEISPETVEKIMGKVIDIDTKGTAYSSIDGFYILKEEYKKEEMENWEKLRVKTQKVLNNGLVGLSKEDTGEVEHDGKPIKEKYIERLKEHGITNQFVYANIVGRAKTNDEKYSSTEIGNSFWVSCDDFNIAVIFDKNFFDEVEPQLNSAKRSFLNDKYTFNADDPKVVENFDKIKNRKPDVKIGDKKPGNGGFFSSFIKAPEGFDENGMPHPHQEFGFVFFPRVPKRTFKGLVVKIPKDESYDQRIQEVAGLVQESNLQIPIYDTDGNVLWPKKMSFEEVKQKVIRNNE
ncbi:MAG: hypothetical protein WC878_04370 [Candidatus Paceibacterota bacterium]|jgi:hypothetical protein